MEEKIQEEEGITLGQIFKAMFHNKIRLAIIGVATMIVLFLFLTLFYNKNNQTYVAMFKYDDVNIANGHYSNGKKFNTLELIDLMEEVKKSNPDKYEKVDVDKIVGSNGVTITEDITVKKVDSEDPTSTDKAEYISSHYTLTCYAKYFPDYKTAKSFMVDLINYPVAKSNDLAQNIVYDENIKLYEKSNIYATQISYLNAQKNYILDGYKALISSYGDIMINGVYLSSKVKEINLFFENHQLDLLSDEITNNGYVKDLSTYKSNLETQKNNLKIESKYNALKIKELKEQRDLLIQQATASSSLQTLDLSTYNTALVTLTQRNLDIDKEIEILDKYLNSATEYVDGKKNENYYDAEKRTVFETKLNEFKDELVGFTSDYKDCYLECIKDYNVYYNDAAKVVRDGKLNPIITLGLPVVAGLVLGCLVNLIVDRKFLSKDYKEEKKELIEEVK